MMHAKSIRRCLLCAAFIAIALPGHADAGRGLLVPVLELRHQIVAVAAGGLVSLRARIQSNGGSSGINGTLTIPLPAGLAFVGVALAAFTLGLAVV